MLAAVAALVIVTQGQNSGSALVSKMLSKYYGAKSMTGTIDYTATDGQGKAGVKTVFQYQTPGLLYIKQEKWGKSTQTWLVTSNGKHFSYNTPDTVDYSTTDKRLVEPLQQGSVLYDYKKVYDIAAAHSLGDRSMPLDVAIGEKEDLKHLSLMWVSATDVGMMKVNNQDVHRISGPWRPYGNANPEGQYEIDVTEDGTLVRYIIQRPYTMPNGDKINITETWDADLKINGTPDPALFKLVN